MEKNHLLTQKIRRVMVFIKEGGGSLTKRHAFATTCGIILNTGLSSLSLLQGIFPTQELNPGLLHCRQILYN